ncbi:MAG: hypothetical protein LBJ96_01575, partial [Holosporaceae bacterium]|nr:hypothetical protein [Holosporaceae bacterium]
MLTPRAEIIYLLMKNWLSALDSKDGIFMLEWANHPEPWIVAMDCDPSKYRILDYGMRWGIECMFSDFKSRGFAITDTHVRKTDRLEKLILILTIALYWAVSIGMTPKDTGEQNHSKK